MGEFIRFLVVSNLALLLVWLSYKILLRRSSFHGLNRGFLLVGSVVSIITPLLPLGIQGPVNRVYVELPALEVGVDVMQASGITLPTNLYMIIYTMGVLMALWFFVRSLASLVRLMKQAESEIVMGELVLRSEKAGPFSFLSIIHLPKKLSTTNLETILKHEMAHVQLGHSYDVLWLSLLRILFWFNPLFIYYMRTVQEIHEYQADALSHTSSTKEHYVMVQLDQLFQLPSELSFANSFYNSINLKKRVNMIYSEKTSKWGAMRYLVAVPLIAAICLIAACTETPAEAVLQEADKVFKGAEVMPEYPGGMESLMNYMIGSIKYPETAEADGLEGKVFVQFVIAPDGKVGQVEVVKSVRDDLDSEAVRVISEMPDWTPGKQDGKNVSVQMVLPIAYNLS